MTRAEAYARYRKLKATDADISINAAAKAIGISQPTLSRAVADPPDGWEEELVLLQAPKHKRVEDEQLTKAQETIRDRTLSPEKQAEFDKIQESHTWEAMTEGFQALTLRSEAQRLVMGDSRRKTRPLWELGRNADPAIRKRERAERLMRMAEARLCIQLANSRQAGWDNNTRNGMANLNPGLSSAYLMATGEQTADGELAELLSDLGEHLGELGKKEIN